MLQLRRGRVTSVEEDDGSVARVTVELGEGERRAAIGYRRLTGEVEPGDEVVVNVEAQDLGLGSGGFDVVCVNLTRGLGATAGDGAHVMKLNYSPIQHAVRPVEEGLETTPARLGMPVAVLALHGQLPPVAFACGTRAPGVRVGFVQTAGGALPGELSRVVAELKERGLLVGHVTVAPCFGGQHEAITVEGALQAGAERLGWQAAIAGPGPGIIGSASALGHGGIEALHNAHASLSVGCPVTFVPRMSSGDPRERHRGLSHHTATALSLLLKAVEVPLAREADVHGRAQLEQAASTGAGHRLVEVQTEDLLRAYRETGLPAQTMGREIDADRDFFRAALAGGSALGERLRAVRG